MPQRMSVLQLKPGEGTRGGAPEGVEEGERTRGGVACNGVGAMNVVGEGHQGGLVRGGEGARGGLHDGEGAMNVTLSRGEIAQEGEEMNDAGEGDRAMMVVRG